ncbi:MAG: ImmA/IrrE family metallo-endopeptidase [Oscillospiraceae bacterium]
MTKAELYCRVDDIRRRYGFAASRDPLCMELFCKRLGLRVEYYPYKTKGLRGVALIDKDMISINSNIAEISRKFYTGHELLHFFFHAERQQVFNCFETPPKDDFMEWEANEGAAEFILPRRAFLHYVADAAPDIHGGRQYYALKRNMAKHFNVSAQNIHYRFQGLKYEIAQCLTGTPINQIIYLSEKQQQHAGIRIFSLNEIYPDIFTPGDMQTIYARRGCGDVVNFGVKFTSAAALPVWL